MYLAVLFMVCWRTMSGRPLVSDPDGESFGIGVGTLVLPSTWCCWRAIRFGCHSLRHLVGGFVDEISKSPVRKKAYDCVSCLNRRHMLFAWMSLFFGRLSRICMCGLCAMGIWTRLENSLDGGVSDARLRCAGDWRGWRGLRAAIEARRPAFAWRGYARSLLGKAHTVMAEGGMAAAHGECGRSR